MSLFFLRIRGVDGKIVKNNFRPTQGINGRCLTSNDDNNGLSFISIYFGILGITINNDKYNMTKNGGWPRWWKYELSFKTDKEIYEILRNKISNFLHRETLIIYKRDFPRFHSICFRPIYYHGLDLIKDKVIKRGCE